MASTDLARSMGFITPGPQDLISGGDDAITTNAITAALKIAENHAAAQSGIAASSTAAQAGIAETAGAAQRAALAAQTAAQQYALEQITRQLRVTHLDLDSDGTPYYAPGADRVQLAADPADGTPYITTTL